MSDDKERELAWRLNNYVLQQASLRGAAIFLPSADDVKRIREEIEFEKFKRFLLMQRERRTER